MHVQFLWQILQSTTYDELKILV